ncbi:MAG: 7-methyl-GTP pyrophosphatase [Gammaproteobacteria bacterium]
MLLERLGLPFETCAPEVDETPRDKEPPRELVARLAEAKARAVADRYPDALIIGSDQVSVVEGQIVGKPGDHATAVEQLKRASGKRVVFLTALCLLNSRSGRRQLDVVPFEVTFRQLSESQIENYLRKDKPYNCAGSFRSESLGIALFERMTGDDPNALVGLPLIRLIGMLENEGVCVI